jgi:hypothetical protein
MESTSPISQNGETVFLPQPIDRRGGQLRLRGEYRPLPPLLKPLNGTRQAAGLTQAEVSRRCGMDEPVRALRTGTTRIRPWTGSRSTSGDNTAEDGIWANAGVYATAQACGAGQDRLAELLNDVELLPEFLADESDGKGECIEMLHSIARAQPSCQYIVEAFECVSTGPA